MLARGAWERSLLVNHHREALDDNWDRPMSDWDQVRDELDLLLGLVLSAPSWLAWKPVRCANFSALHPVAFGRGSSG